MTRNGKIARLPDDLREELNRRLQNAEPGGRLLAWLNALPAVQKVLQDQFAGHPVSKQNLSEWRAGGFSEWQTQRDFLANAQDIAAGADQVAEAAQGRLSSHLATVLAARYAGLLLNWNGEVTAEFGRKIRTLGQLTRTLTVLRRCEPCAGVATACRHTPASPATPPESNPVAPSQTTFAPGTVINFRFDPLSPAGLIIGYAGVPLNPRYCPKQVARTVLRISG